VENEVSINITSVSLLKHLPAEGVVPYGKEPHSTDHIKKTSRC